MEARHGRAKVGWIGVDLDGVLAVYDGWRGPEHVGRPIHAVVQAVRDLVASGREVRVFTARACIPSQIPPVEKWLAYHGLAGLAVTCVKDIGMVELWDDRCVQFVPNTGYRVEDFMLENARKMLDHHRQGGVVDTYSQEYIDRHTNASP